MRTAMTWLATNNAAATHSTNMWPEPMQLRERLDRERDISAASTWTDRDTAERTVAAALRANKEKIDRWMARGYPRPNLALHFNAEQTIGRSLRHGESKVVPAKTAVVVLKADSADSFYVLTTYPEARE